jgi:hypothetical protein
MFSSPHVSSPALRPTQSPLKWIPELLPEVTRPACVVEQSTHFHRRVSKWLELYDYSSSVRAWLRPLPFPNYQHAKLLQLHVLFTVSFLFNDNVTLSYVGASNNRNINAQWIVKDGLISATALAFTYRYWTKTLYFSRCFRCLSLYPNPAPSEYISDVLPLQLALLAS